MTIAVPNSAFALNDDAWAIRVAEAFPDGLRFLLRGPIDLGTPKYTTMPAPVLGSGAGAVPSMVPSGNDLYDEQWHFDRLGDIETIWDEYSGAGVHVGIYDDGVQSTHPDLAANYDASLHVTVDGQIIDALEGAMAGSPHGTAVAGLIAAANNDTGTIGVAWSSSITGVTIFSGLADINYNYPGFLEAIAQSANFDVINHSWGKYPGFWQDGVSNAQDQFLIDRWFDALENGRGGLGTIQVKAAGNADQNSNGDAAGVSRATIVVGAYDDDGDASYYSSYGSNLLVSAPSSGRSGGLAEFRNAGQVTTDIVNWGYNGLDDDLYTNAFGGTSGATPIVTGVVALMLEANPNLGWRDVQNILAYSAHEVGSGVGGVQTADENNTWKYNGADNWNGGGLHYSEDYGFGGVNAYNAVRMAEVWHLFEGPQASGNESSFEQSTTQSVSILDGKQTDIHFQFGGPDFTVDFVDVSINLNHPHLDDLEIYLISPDGTVTTLIDFRYELQYTSDITEAVLNFGANAFRGENGAGEWTIRIIDRWLADEGTVNSASVTLHGSDSANGQNDFTNDVYHYTDEVFLTLARDGTRYVLNDTDGGTDWLDMSTMASNLLVRLSSGAISTADSKGFVRIGNNTIIENAIAGDGNDRMYGSDGNNTLYGMRGNDSIHAGLGDDIVSGGAGNDLLEGSYGADIFLFDRALNAVTNVDTIYDFNLYPQAEYGADHIWLESAIFGGLSLGTLNADAFITGTSAADGSDRIIYDPLSGNLYFDADGTGSISAIQFAILLGNPFIPGTAPPTLSFSDFIVVDTSNGIVVGTGADRDQPDAPTTVTSTDTNVYGGNNPIYGTAADDEILGKDGDDVIYGLEGRDLLAGRGGNDIIYGGADQDFIYGMDGDDILHGGDGPQEFADYIYGGNGNDVIYGGKGNWSDLRGGNGDDIIYGNDGNDSIDGDGEDFDRFGGNDTIYGGKGDDGINGGWGNDHLHGGLGYNVILGGESEFDVNGFDTVHFEGNFDDYDIVTMQFQGPFSYTPYGLTFDRLHGLSAGEVENTAIDMNAVEALQFADRYIDLRETPLILNLKNEVSNNQPVVMIANGFEVVALVNEASDVTITDLGRENGTVDKLKLVQVAASGNVVINSDAIEMLSISNLFSDDHPNVWNWTTPFTGDITVNAAAGDRDLSILLTGGRLDAGERISDNTATKVIFNTGEAWSWLNGAATNDYNLSFASAETMRFYQTGKMAIDWYIPNVTTIDLRYTYDEFGPIAGQGQLSITRIDTSIDDSLLATAGSTSEFRYYGGWEQDIIQLGNLGSVNVSNDGTTGPDVGLNSGLGLRGELYLGEGADQVRILGSGAFQGGTIDAGYNGDDYQGNLPDHDVIRMTFGVAAAIGDISSHISGFESVQFDVNSQSHTVDVTNFDSLRSVIVNGSAGVAGTNTVNLLDESKVTIQSVNGGINFGTVNLLGSASALTLSFTAPWVQMEAPPGALEASIPSGPGTGTIHVADAVRVDIKTDSRADYIEEYSTSSGVQKKYLPAVDSFAQTLVLDVATEVTVAGDTGWDFTTVGTDIGNVTRIDGSGITGTGAVGGITAAAQTAASVTFIGGAGDDVFTGGAGADTLRGGKGNDTFIIDAGSAGDTIDGGEGTGDTVSSAVSSLNLANYTNVENAMLTGNGNLDLTGDAGANVLKGNAGNNVIDGGNGADTVVFSGSSADYDVTTVGGVTTVTDLRGGAPDGIDTLSNVEYLQFSDVRRSVDPNAPTDILISKATIAELYFDSLVGRLSSVDAVGDTATFELLDDAGGRFYIANGNELRSVSNLLIDYEQNQNHEITVRVTDLDGLTYEKTITINVLDTNPETVGGSAGNDVIYGGGFNDYLDGAGGDDALRGNGGSDIIVGGTGIDTAEFSGLLSDYKFEFQKDYIDAITVTDLRSDAAGGGFDGIDFVIYDWFLIGGVGFNPSIEHLKFADGTIVNTWDLIAPKDISLSASTVSEAADAGSVVATLTTEDLSTLFEETFTYTLLNDAGGRFAIDGDKIVVAPGAVLDYETATSHGIQVRVTDSDGHTFDKTFTISVTDVADENTAATVSLANMRTSIAENTSTAQRIKVADIVVNDDGVGTNTLGLVGRNAALFEIIGMALFLKAGVALDARTMTTLDVAVTVDDDTIDGTPDHTSSTYKLAVADVAGVTVINGNSGNNTLTGTSGNDYFDGHGGSDTFKGGKGNDVYVVDSAGDKVIEAAGQGTDTVHASVSHTLATNVEYLMLQGTGAINGTGNASNNLLVGNSGNNTLAGGAGNDRLYGGAGNDTLDGGTGNDRLFGQDGNDTLLGGTGDDRLDGGIGRDVLRGGTGKDVFVFNEVSESAVGSARDVITDFMRGQDKIDLSAIDAREATSANDAFTWFGTKAFTGAAGQLRFNDLGAEVFVQGDVDGDGVADFEIHVKVATVAASDFIL
jgi:Ca2+-binding RTX toxin-like protein